MALREYIHIHCVFWCIWSGIARPWQFSFLVKDVVELMSERLYAESDQKQSQHDVHALKWMKNYAWDEANVCLFFTIKSIP